MNQASGNEQPPNGTSELVSLAAELRKEADRLRQLAEDLDAWEREHQEMVANYPYFKRFVYDRLREQFEREVPPLPPDKDLETIAREEGAMSFEEFLARLEL